MTLTSLSNTAKRLLGLPNPLCILLCTLAMSVCAHAASILVEAEQFDNLGGWTADAQFIDQMGSTYLLAHGLGTPVDDAVTKVSLPEKGRYYVYARTYNWTSPWETKNGPGRFRVAVDGKNLRETLGNTGTEWQWQYAGSFKTDKNTVALSLHDLSGFDGRCDAIYLTTERQNVPPTDKAALADFRKSFSTNMATVDGGSYDLVVVGGGIAGMHAAVSAARLGLKVALLQNRPVLGGNNSSEVRVHLGGCIDIGKYPALGAMLKEYAPTIKGNAREAAVYADDDKLSWIKAEPNITLCLNTHVNGVETAPDGSIVAVKGVDTHSGQSFRYSAPLFCDATGDGTVGFLAGADYMMGRESRDEFGEPSAPEVGDNLTMGTSVQWRSSDISIDEKTGFPHFEWGISFNDSTCRRTPVGEWTWETGMYDDQLNDFERVRDYGMLVAYANWSYLVNKLKLYPDKKLDWVAYVGGKRESRRLLGDYILKEDDLVKRVFHEDASFTSTWSLDLHFPDPENSRQFPGGAFIASNSNKYIYPYGVPYRCLYSRNVPNLFMAGRDISCTHVALGTVRVMRTGAMMGEVVGMAAMLCKQHGTNPRGVYHHHLAELKQLMTDGTARGPLDHKQRYNRGKHLKD